MIRSCLLHEMPASLACWSPNFIFQSHGTPGDLHSFPTRRSSDLARCLADTRNELTVDSYRKTFYFTGRRSEEHTSELQSRRDLVCRILLEKTNVSHSRQSCLSRSRRQFSEPEYLCVERQWSHLNQ